MHTTFLNDDQVSQVVEAARQATPGGLTADDEAALRDWLDSALIGRVLLEAILAANVAVIWDRVACEPRLARRESPQSADIHSP